MKPTIGIIIPTYGAFEYAARAVASAYTMTRTASPVVIVVDDASPEWLDLDEEDAPEPLYSALVNIPPERKRVFRFQQNGGLTRSWNAGLDIAVYLQCTYACCTNSDVVFSPDWDGPLIHALDAGYSLVGPVTNAPGSESIQDVRTYDPTAMYKVNDDPASIAETATILRAAHGSTAYKATINGFCMLARTVTWHDNAFDHSHVFKPRNDFTSKGQRNPTPLMTLNEYELQRRWHKSQLRTGFCPGSFVFHYRSVSRGDRYTKGQAYRIGK